MLRKCGLNLDGRGHDGAGSSKKRRRLGNDFNQYTLDGLVNATVTWLEDDHNRTLRDQGQGPEHDGYWRKGGATR